MDNIPRGIRLCNPGNIRISDTHWLGKCYPSKDPDFETFEDIMHGIRAAAIIFLNYNRLHGLSTIAQYIQRWAPPADNNPTDAYAKYVASDCGVDPNNIYNLEDVGNLSKLLASIFRFEQGGEFITSEQLTEGINLAFPSV